jgi:hypothetical protein
MVTQSRRKKQSIISITGIKVVTCYCRACQLTKAVTEFDETNNTLLDANGINSICRPCENRIFNELLEKYGSVDRAIDESCRLFDIAFNEIAADNFKKYIAGLERDGKSAEFSFGTYITMVKRVQGSRSLRYVIPEPKIIIQERQVPVEVIKEVPVEVIKEVYIEKPLDEIADEKRQFWGDNLENSDYAFLDKEFQEWKREYMGENKADNELYKMLSHKALEIRKARDGEGRNMKDLEASYQTLMKTANVDPQKQQEKKNKSQEAFGVWIQQIETKRPAEWFAEQTKFHDMDGIDEDIKDIKRSMSNFVTGSRDFNTTDLDEMNELELNEEAEETNDASN